MKKKQSLFYMTILNTMISLNETALFRLSYINVFIAT